LEPPNFPRRSGKNFDKKAEDCPSSPHASAEDDEDELGDGTEDELGGLDDDGDADMLSLSTPAWQCKKCTHAYPASARENPLERFGGDDPATVDCYRNIFSEKEGKNIKCEGEHIPIANPVSYEINRKWAEMSKLVAHIIKGDKGAKEITFKNIKPDVLQKVHKYLLLHGKNYASEPQVLPAAIVKPITSADFGTIVENPEDVEFINGLEKTTEKYGINETIFKVILGANYMDIKSLIHLGIAKIATTVKQMEPDEIKKILAEDISDKRRKGDASGKYEGKADES